MIDPITGEEIPDYYDQLPEGWVPTPGGVPRDPRYDVPAGLSSPGPYPGMLPYPGLTPEQVQESMAGTEREFLVPQLTAQLGRAPSASELQQAHVIWRNEGGNGFRSWVAGLGQTNTDQGGAVPGTTNYPLASGEQYFEYPDWVPPDIQFSDFAAPNYDVQPFSYEEFVGPTAETFKADPGYEFREGRMLRALKNDRSARGLLATGGTLTDLMEAAGGLASQEFGNVWNRDYQKYNTNRGNAFQTWGANKGLEDDEFTRALTSYLTQESKKGDDWTRDLTRYQTNLGKTATGYGLNLDTSGLNLQRDQAKFGNLASLYEIATRNLPRYTPSAAA